MELEGADESANNIINYYRYQRSKDLIILFREVRPRGFPLRVVLVHLPRQMWLQRVNSQIVFTGHGSVDQVGTLQQVSKPPRPKLQISDINK